MHARSEQSAQGHTRVHQRHRRLPVTSKSGDFMTGWPGSTPDGAHPTITSLGRANKYWLLYSGGLGAHRQGAIGGRYPRTSPEQHQGVARRHWRRGTTGQRFGTNRQSSQVFVEVVTLFPGGRLNLAGVEPNSRRSLPLGAG